MSEERFTVDTPTEADAPYPTPQPSGDGPWTVGDIFEGGIEVEPGGALQPGDVLVRLTLLEEALEAMEATTDPGVDARAEYQDDFARLAETAARIRSRIQQEGER